MNIEWRKALVIFEQILILILSTILLVWGLILQMDMRTLVTEIQTPSWKWGIIAIGTVLIVIVIEIIRRSDTTDELKDSRSEGKGSKIHVILLGVIIILAIGNIVIVPKASHKLSKLRNYYQEVGTYEPFSFTYNRGDLEMTILDNDGTSDGKPLDRTIELLDSIPTEMLKQISDSNYKIVIDGASLAQYSYDKRDECGDEFCYMVLVQDSSRDVIISHCTPASEDVVKCLTERSYTIEEL